MGRARALVGGLAVLLACTPDPGRAIAGPLGQVVLDPADPPHDAADVEPGLAMSFDPPRPLLYRCKQPAPVDSGYRFELDGASVDPRITSLAGGDLPRAGDIIHLDLRSDSRSPLFAPDEPVARGSASMVLGQPGLYSYFTVSAHPDALELAYDGGARHLVHLQAEDLPGRPTATLRQLRGLSLGTWSDDVAAALARLDGAGLVLDYTLADGQHAPNLRLPPRLHGLRLGVALGDFLGLLRGEITADGPLVLADLADLGQLRYLHLDVTQIASGGPSWVNAADLARLATLEHLRIDASLPVHDLERLRDLTRLRVLDLSGRRQLTDLGFVPGLPALRRLDVGRTGVTSLAPLAGHPQLVELLADGSPIARLPMPPPPALRTLGVMATGLDDAIVEEFAALAPAVDVHHRWDQKLADVGACATRIVVRAGGVCHRRPAFERVFFVHEDPAAVRELLPLLRLDESLSDTSCMCCGALTIELHRDAELLAAVSLHHGKTLRWYGWPGDGRLADPAPLCAWLTRHGAPDVCSERQDGDE